MSNIKCPISQHVMYLGESNCLCVCKLSFEMGRIMLCTWKRAPWGFFGVYLSQCLRCLGMRSDVGAFPGPPNLLPQKADTGLLQFYVLRGYCIINQTFISWDKSTALFWGSWMQLHSDILANMWCFRVSLGEKTSSGGWIAACPKASLPFSQVHV